MISQKAITDFQRIWKEEFNENLSDGEAEQHGTRLLKFFETLIKIDQRKSKNENQR